MRAAVLHIGENNAHGPRPVLLLRPFAVSLHFAHIIGVTDGDIAGAGINSPDLGSVAARRFFCQIVFQARQPCAECRLAQMSQLAGKQSVIIRMLAAAHANTPLKIWPGQRAVAETVAAYTVA